MRARRLLGAVVAVVALHASAASAAPGALNNPTAFKSPSSDVRPKFRWWWGNFIGTGSIDQATVVKELQAMHDAGFGAAEIGFTSAVWANGMQRQGLQAALLKARQLGMKVDMTLGASWPFATPNTGPGTGLSEQELMYGRTDLTGPSTFSGSVPKAIGDSSNPPKGKVIAVTAARVIQAGPAVTQPGTPPSSSTILDPGSLVDLTSKLKPDGTISWDVPAGNWILFAFWQRDSSEGVVDHLSAVSAKAALKYLDDNQIGAADAPLLPQDAGNFFEDSLELDASELFWTWDFQKQFRARRGYDMTKYLPLMFVEGEHHYWVPEKEPTPDFELPDGSGYRYRHDYYETETDLYNRNHLDVIAAWAKQHGMRFRSQVAYGNSFDVTRSARDIVRHGGLADDESLNAGDRYPFDLSERDWHFAFDHYRTLVAGAHQAGSDEVGDELGAVFLNELMMGLPDYKHMMDKAWAAGVTRPVIHGYQSQVPGDAWPGTSHFLGVVSDSWNAQTFPQWAMWKPLTDYWARGAEVLQTGRPRTDVAIYRDGFSTTAATITGEVPENIDSQFSDLPQGIRQPLDDAYAGQMPPRPSPFFDTEPLERAGFTVEYLDPVGLRDPQAAGDGVLYPRTSGYRALVVDSRWMPAATARALDADSARGLRVVFVGQLPARSDSGYAPVAGDVAVKKAMHDIVTRDTTAVVAAQSDVAGALADLGVRPAASWPGGLRLYTQRREVGADTYYYVWNPTDQAVRVTGSFLGRGRGERLDLWTGAIDDLPVYRQAGDRVLVPLELGPTQTTILAFRGDQAAPPHLTATGAPDVVQRGGRPEVEAPQGGSYTVRSSDGSSRDVTLADPPAPIDLPTTSWALSVDEVGPEGSTPRLLPVAALGDWRKLPGLTNASGTGTYTATLTLPANYVAPGVGLKLDLGQIAGAAQLSVNGRLATPELSPESPVDITDLVHAGDNAIEVVLTTTLKNKAVSVLPLTLPSRPAFAATPGTQPYGLMGPVTLEPFARSAIDAG